MKNVTRTVTTKRKMNINSKIIIGIVALIVVLIVLVLLIFPKGNTVDISDYVEVKYAGIDGGGRTEVTLNKEKLYTDIVGDEKNTVILSRYMNLIDSIKIEPENSGKLSNGDTATFNVTFDEANAKSLKCTFAPLKFTRKVSDLGEGRRVDLFEHIEVTVSGFSPQVFALVSNKWEDEILSNISFSLDKSNNISKGDTIVVRCNVTQTELEENGISPIAMSKEYKIENVNSYASDVSALDAQALLDLKSEAEALIVSETESLTFRMFYKATNDSAYLFEYNDEKVNSVEFVNAAFLYPKEGASVETYNYIYFIFKANITNGTTTSDIYFAFEYSDAVMSNEGIFSVEHNDMKNRYICGMDMTDVYSRVVLSKEKTYTIVQFTL